MPRCLLMFGDRLVKVEERSFQGGVPESIRYAVCARIEWVTPSTADNYYTNDSSTSFGVGGNSAIQQLVFRAHRQIGPDSYEYQFDHVQSDKSFTLAMYEEVRELPALDSKLAMSNLVATMKGGSTDVRKLLERYLNAERDLN